MTERISRLWALIKKEFLTILRDPKSRIIIIAPPLIQLALFANILTMETKNADIGGDRRFKHAGIAGIRRRY